MFKTALAVAFSFCLFSACSNTHTFTTKDGSVTADKDGHSAHIVARDGTAVNISEQGMAVVDYPSDAPIYEGKSMMDAKVEKQHMRTIMMQTGDSLEKVTEFYKGALENKGWKVDSSVNTPQATIFRATKENRKLSISIGRGDDGKTSVTQVLQDVD